MINSILFVYLEDDTVAKQGTWNQNIGNCLGPYATWRCRVVVPKRSVQFFVAYNFKS